MEHLRGASENIRLGWKSLPGINTLAYYENQSITDKKSFITLAPGRSRGWDGAAVVAVVAAVAADVVVVVG